MAIFSELRFAGSIRRQVSAKACNFGQPGDAGGGHHEFLGLGWGRGLALTAFFNHKGSQPGELDEVVKWAERHFSDIAVYRPQSTKDKLGLIKSLRFLWRFRPELA
jgi:hypothetical protein